ncbi:MAG: dihydroneopterin aldolase [Gaiellales bacterium]
MIAPTIEVRGLRVFAHHGVLVEERRRGQEFVLDLELVCPPSDAARSDDVADAVDYAEVCDRAVELVRGGPYNLIETLADIIARDLVARYRLQRATVRVAKPNAPIPHPLTEVAVTVTHPQPRPRGSGRSSDQAKQRV